MSKRYEIRLIGDHPHSGCSGYVEVDDDGKAQVVMGDMFLVTLTDCEHMTNACYAKRSNMATVHTTITPIEPSRRSTRRSRRTER